MLLSDDMSLLHATSLEFEYLKNFDFPSDEFVSQELQDWNVKCMCSVLGWRECHKLVPRASRRVREGSHVSP